MEEGLKMPEYICPECGKKYTGWAMMFIKCYCECGYLIYTKEGR